jgi:hypothetical protein
MGTVEDKRTTKDFPGITRNRVKSAPHAFSRWTPRALSKAPVRHQDDVAHALEEQPVGADTAVTCKAIKSVDQGAFGNYFY